jgi:hypothetical protein
VIEGTGVVVRVGGTGEGIDVGVEGGSVQVAGSEKLSRSVSWVGEVTTLQEIKVIGTKNRKYLLICIDYARNNIKYT